MCSDVFSTARYGKHDLWVTYTDENGGSNGESSAITKRQQSEISLLHDRSKIDPSPQIIITKKRERSLSGTVQYKLRVVRNAVKLNLSRPSLASQSTENVTI